MSGPTATPITSSATRDLWKVAETGEIGQLIELLARGADVNASNQAGVTALMLAAFHGRLEMVRALTDHGADVNTTDRDGFTAAMLAQHSHREDIVRLLVARGARIIPKAHSTETTSIILTQYQTSGALHVSDAPEKKTLDAPPNIWDVVHETHVAFDPRSAFFGHLRSINPHLFALIALIVGGGALLGFVWLRGWSETAPPVSGVKPESSSNQTIPSSPANAPDTTVSSSDQQSGSQPTAPTAAESPSPQQTGMTAGAARLASSALNPKIAAATPEQPARRVAAKPTPTNQSTQTPVRGATLTSTGNGDNPDKAQTSVTPAAKSEIKKNGEPLLQNKESEKAPTPAPAVPARVRPTPNS
jgi:Ankyrin repeats (3 copies)